MFENNTLIPTLPASDLNRARQWYADKLDLKPSGELPDGGLRYECGDAWFLLYESQFAGSNKATAAAWQIGDHAGTVAKLQKKGVVFEEYDIEGYKTENGIMTLPDGSNAAWFKDSEGNIIGLFHMA